MTLNLATFYAHCARSPIDRDTRDYRFVGGFRDEHRKGAHGLAIAISLLPDEENTPCVYAIMASTVPAQWQAVPSEIIDSVFNAESISDEQVREMMACLMCTIGRVAHAPPTLQPVSSTEPAVIALQTGDLPRATWILADEGERCDDISFHGRGLLEDPRENKGPICPGGFGQQGLIVMPFSVKGCVLSLSKAACHPGLIAGSKPFIDVDPEAALWLYGTGEASITERRTGRVLWMGRDPAGAGQLHFGRRREVAQRVLTHWVSAPQCVPFKE